LIGKRRDYSSKQYAVSLSRRNRKPVGVICGRAASSTVAIEPCRLDRKASPKTRLIRGHFTWSSTGIPRHAALGDDHPLIYRCVDETVQDAGAVWARTSMISVIGAPSARHRGKKGPETGEGAFPATNNHQRTGGTRGAIIGYM
jgi:hypothetical protein